MMPVNTPLIMLARLNRIAGLQRELDARVNALSWLQRLLYGPTLRKMLALSDHTVAHMDARLDDHEADLLKLSAMLGKIERGEATPRESNGAAS